MQQDIFYFFQNTMNFKNKMKQLKQNKLQVRECLFNKNQHIAKHVET
jgi:hypothetical protein